VFFGIAEIISDAYKDERFNPEVDLKTGFVTRSIMVAPLKVRERLIGVAEVINRKDGKPFEKEDLELFKAFCRQVAMAIETARLRKMEEEKQRLEQQLEAAKWIQKSFLPEPFPTTEAGRIEIAATSLPAAAVGGDFYDYVILDNGKIGVSIGDVAGKGIPAALFMARLISDFRLFSQRISSPGKLTTVLNRKVAERSRRGMFVTFIYGLLDTSNLTFRFSNAGHLPIVHIPANGGEIKLFKGSGGVPLGILPNAEYSETTITLSKGDFLVLISDGIVEAKNSSGKAFQFAHLLNTLSASAPSAPSAPSAQALMEKLMNAVQQFTSGAIQHDDSTVVVIRVK
jgi:sigma-B regulation protein RsbU (phosphoserine phosphatase)